MRSAVAAVLVAMAAINAEAAVIRVPSEQPTIQSALAVAAAGDEIRIAAGTYSEPMQETPAFRSMLVVPPGVALVGEGEVILDARGTGRVIYLSPGWVGLPFTRLENLTLRNGFTQGSGGGIYSTLSWVEITGLRFENNEALVMGGGLRHGLGTFTIEDSEFTGNYAENGGGLSTGANGFHAFRCTFSDCMASPGGGGAFHLRGDLAAQLTDCLVYDCLGNDGAWVKLEEGAGTILMGCSFVGRGLSGMNSGIHLYDYCSISIYRSILTGARGKAITFHQNVSLHMDDCNDIWGNSTGDWIDELAQWYGVNGNFSADPLFCSPSGNDFHLSSLSPCAPEHNSCGLQIGALPVACETTGAAETSWGEIKFLY